jgi:hypothetical protein
MNCTKKILLYNPFPYHYEIIESCMVKVNEIFDYEILNNNRNKINIKFEIQYHPEPSFEIYLLEKYKDKIDIDITFIAIESKFLYINLPINDIKYDYVLYITTSLYYLKELMKKVKNKSRFICHDFCPDSFNDSYKDLEYNKKNILFLTPIAKNFKSLVCDILPFVENIKKNKVPIYVIQGNLDVSRRYFELLKKLLDKCDFELPFKIKLVGRGPLPCILNKVEYEKYLICKSDLNFIDYHKEFLDAYCILPLISKEMYPQYYEKRLTSSMNYGKAYKLYFLIDNDLNDIYKEKKAFVYDSKSFESFYSKFKESLNNFYKQM